VRKRSEIDFERADCVRERVRTSAISVPCGRVGCSVKTNIALREAVIVKRDVEVDPIDEIVCDQAFMDGLDALADVLTVDSDES
jgi:hypothetical protein